MGLPEDFNDQQTSFDAEKEQYTPYEYQEEGNTSWAGALPVKQGLYDPDLEKDACGVGFACHIKGKPSHKIVSDARNLLCNMTHRGAVGSDVRDGDGAGVMTSIPHKFFIKNFEREENIKLPPLGQYAVGNLFFKPDEETLQESKRQLEDIAESLGLRVLGWRRPPVDSTLLGPAARSREPIILQPFVVLASAYGTGVEPEMTDPEKFDDRHFEIQLFILRKRATHTIGLHNWFYLCSLSNKNIVYKGQLAPVQVYQYYHDLVNADYEGHFALVHSRFSTNTFPSWDRAQPLRWAAHNGEINTLRGNKNWMRAREGVMQSDVFKDELEKLYPIVEDGGSDSAAFDNVLELLTINGVLSLPEAVMLMVPEAWQGNTQMDATKAAFYEWAACQMEPWDGPALFTFADGRFCGANLDRNGLRPCRFYVMDDDRIICASEVGTIPVEPETVIQKGRLQPGKMLLVDTVAGRIIDDKELKEAVSSRHDFRSWLDNNLLTMSKVQEKLETSFDLAAKPDDTLLQQDPLLLAFGFTHEQVSLLLAPMASDEKEALGSMGNDAPLACLSQAPRLLYEYFRQLFAQVTNPPIDPIRESVVMSLECYVGPQGNLLEMDASQTGRLLLPSPILSIPEFNAIKNMSTKYSEWTVKTIDLTFPKSEGVEGYLRHLDFICDEATAAIEAKDRIIVLSDRATSAERVPVSALLASGMVHHHLVSNKWRAHAAIVLETAEAREVHHMCVLLGYGADAINPYLAMECILKLNREKLIKKKLTDDTLIHNYKHSCDGGILKVMSKMGISTLASYKGAQIFEILGLDDSIVERCFKGTASRIQGSKFEYIAEDAFRFHERGFPSRYTVGVTGLPESGEYHWRDGGEAHINDPTSIANIQDAVRTKNDKSYEAYSLSESVTPSPSTKVEPWTEIVRRFCTGAMSYGSISMESHSTLAVAMNRLGGKSNTGEGGEDPERSQRMANGDTMRSAIKQIASGRFGVTSNYLADSDELQIKMAQGAKPGEGGELPGHKVSKSIARTRHSTPGVGLISPPPHHDIYSIEDLKQLIYDLKCSAPRSRVSVKLVSEVGVGIVASGVAKAKADHVLISGHDGGTGASRWTGIKYAGLPWELGLAETHQTLVLNDLRGRVVVQTDGQLRTGRDIAIACLLGAEEWGFATAPLIAMGFAQEFTGTPEHVINFFYYLANELRAIMARLGFRTINEMVGHAEVLKVRDDLRNSKTQNIDLSLLLTPAHKLRPGVATFNVRKQDHKLHVRLDNKLISEAELTLDKGLPSRIECDIINTDRAMGTSLSYHISKRYGEAGLPLDTVHVNIKGFRWACPVARLIVYPPRNAVFKAEENIIIGNTCLYGATSGSCFSAVLLPSVLPSVTLELPLLSRVTGRNFAAGMSGGIAYVLDINNDFHSKLTWRWWKPLPLAPGRLQPCLPRFVKVLPVDYKRVLEEEAAKAAEAKANEYNLPIVSGVQHKKKEEKAAKLQDIRRDRWRQRCREEARPRSGQDEGFMKYQLRSEKYRSAKTRTKAGPSFPAPQRGRAQVPGRLVARTVVFLSASRRLLPHLHIIPKWNELVFQKPVARRPQPSLDDQQLPPSFTGTCLPWLLARVPCSRINEDPVGIKSIESHRQENIAIIGSGPAGLAAADQLNRAGHLVTVYERADRPGVLLMYGIPNMKLDKRIVSANDAVIIATGATVARDLPIKGRELEGIHSLLDSELADGSYISAKDKDVIVIAVGDTGNDCMVPRSATAPSRVTTLSCCRSRPRSAATTPVPQWPRIYRVDYGHTEVKQHTGKDPREYCSHVGGVCRRRQRPASRASTPSARWTKSPSGGWDMKKLESRASSSRRTSTPQERQDRRRASSPTNLEGVFAAGDCRSGQSLIVWGINEGRQAAREVDLYLEQYTALPVTGGIVKHTPQEIFSARAKQVAALA
ncbi:glutamate synthase [Verticillium dahliae]|nr:glutamate synthase [Verticillium dahliae]